MDISKLTGRLRDTIDGIDISTKKVGDIMMELC